MNTSIAPVTVRAISAKPDLKRFVDYVFARNQSDPNWVPPLRDEAFGLLDARKNPWFEHGRQQLFLAERSGKVVGRISAHIDTLALEQPADKGFGPGTGFFGLFDADDEDTGRLLLTAAEQWLRNEGMTRSVGPVSISIWDEPGLLTSGFDHPPTVMMGHNRPEYADWITDAGYAPVKRLVTYEVPIEQGFPPIVQRIVAAGEKNARIRIRRVDKSRFDDEAQIILNILNDAWADNWGFVPITDSEVAYIGKKLKPLVFGDLIRIAEYDGEPVAFMIVLPDLNEQLITMGGKLFPFNWARLLMWLRKPKARTMRVPLMGVLKRLQNSRLASQLAFMMIEFIRRDAVAHYGATRGEIGWILDDNQGMNAIADAIESKVNKTYDIYARPL